MRENLLHLFVVIGLPLISVAQTDTASVSIDEVAIIEERVPHSIADAAQSISIISGEMLIKENVANLNEVLAYVSGVDLRQRGAQGVQADVGIRGSSFEQVLILLNGMKMNDPQTGHHHLNLPVPLQSIERIEVIKGPMAHIYGPNAFAGVINIITKVPEEAGGNVSGLYGSYNLREVQASVALPTGKYRQLISGSWSAADAWTHNTDFNIGNLFYQGVFEHQAHRLEVMGAYNDKKFGANGFYGSSDFRDQYEETSGVYAGLNYTYQLSERQQIRTTVYQRRHTDRWVFFRENPDFFENRHRSRVDAAELVWQHHGERIQWFSGIDLRRESIASTNLDTLHRDIVSGYVNARYRLGRLTVNPGLNVSKIGNYDLQAFPSLSFSFQADDHWNAFANIGRSYRVPSFTDLYYEGPENIGNAGLQPESAWSTELGVRRTQSFWQMQASVFGRQTGNAIEWVRPQDSTQWQPQNFHEIRTVGVEVEQRFLFSAIAGPGFFLEDVRFSYTFLHSDFLNQDELQSKYAFEYLRHQAFVRVRHKVAGPVKHHLSVRFADRYHLPEVFTIDSRLYYEKNRLLFFIEAANLLDRRYRETNLVELPGRWIRGGFNWNFGGRNANG